MSKILGIDYGKKRVGLALTDDLQIIAAGLTTVEEKEALPYLRKLFEKEKIEAVVIGEPRNLDFTLGTTSTAVHVFGDKLKAMFPDTPIHYLDERYTSKMAAQSLVAGGVKKKDRQNKSLLDEVSATLILQSFLEQKAFRR
jgi:putative holliday junction resolvase